MSGAIMEFAGPILFATVSAAVFIAARALALFAARRGLLPDRPNARSSHSVATPRAGGMAIAGAFAAGAFFFIAGHPAAGPDGFALIFIMLIVFAAGIIDDRYGLSAAWKFVAQFAAALLFLYFIGGLERGPAPFFGDIALGPVGGALTVLWIVGFMNAFNFMDGVNGIAAACGVLALAGLAVAAAAAGAPVAAGLSALGAAALFGFLPVNFPSGRIFMGDSGSQSVGFLIAALALLATHDSAGTVSALFMATAMAPFLFDVAFTLAHRAARRRNILAGHREHLYQLIVRLGGSHARATAVFVTLTALSTAAAFALPSLPPAWQWLVPAGLCALFLWPALRLFKRARAAGLLQGPSDEPSADETAEEGAGYARAAE